MTNDKNEATMDALVGELLGLDPAVLATVGEATRKAKAAAAADRDRRRALAGLEPEGSSEATPFEAGAAQRGAASKAGLNRFAHRVLALTLALEDDEGAAVRLKSEHSARANGWPDARTANVAMVMVWALLQSGRALKGLPDAPLMLPSGARGPAAEPLDPAVDDSVATAVLVERLGAPARVAAPMGARRARGHAAAKPVGREAPSGNALIRELLGLDPKVLASAFDSLLDEPGAAFAKDPERAGRAGLEILLRDALTQYHTMVRRRVYHVRLMTELDAKEGRRPDARSANLCTLMACGLICENGWEVSFLPAREPTASEVDLLRRVAHHAYFHGSEQAFAALELLCDDDVHFGTNCGYTKADMLFQAVRREQDPDARHIRTRPYGLQLKSLSLDEGLRFAFGHLHAPDGN